MNDDRHRIPQDSVYFQTIGLAVVSFARLEWDAVWCCERLESDYIRTIKAQKKTAGKIAGDLGSLFSRVSDAKLRSKIIPFAKEFKEIVGERNDLLHANPAKSNEEEERLVGHHGVLTIVVIKAFSDRCARAAVTLNALLYAELAEPCSVVLSDVVHAT